ncbi:SIMPL domain-containing protein [Candidatus Campylobacter infans]|uniref:SIMPL domain-containing protein n=1 Tax=Candidatus Campylobacter infans TaxID=2561898 RepID=A0A7H9CHW6_9BACT|nr:SIMPL domain-containing protein [Candidatus Campylobacter infans]QLI04955.1 SIMPL domain-containing protein [Candidatus Campylobacter infans]
MQNKNNFYFLGICLVIASIVISLGFSSINPKEASVSVRGLAQREVNADLAVWQLSFGLGDNNLENLQKSIKEKSEIVSLYLKDKGLNERDFSVLSPSITNNLLDPYINQEKMQYIYIAKLNFLIRTDKISAVKKANEGLLELVDKGIAIKQDYENKINYEFTKLNDIKPEMIALATKNARKAAEQFAKDSNSNLGKIKHATQGLFSIENAATGLEERKIVRVVTQIQYLLK